MNKSIMRVTICFIIFFNIFFLLMPQAQEIIPESQMVKNLILCKDIENNEPVMETDSFNTWDEKAVAWIQFNHETDSPFVVSWEWVDPTGKIYHIGQLEMDAGIYQNYRSWYWISIKEHYATNITGNWRVRIFIGDDFLAAKNFTIY